MSGTQPVGVYAMKVPPGVLLPAVPDFAAMFRVSMAAIDPTEEPMYDEDETEKKAPRATLKIVRIPGDMFGDDEDDSEDDDEDAMDLLNGLDESSEENSEEEEVNGGPSEPKKAKAIKAEDEEDAGDDDEDMDDNSDSGDAEAVAALKKIMKGKAKAEGSDDDEDDLEDDEDPLDLEEIVVCTLDPEKNYQQTLDFVVGEDERVFFKVIGTHTIHLTGNYVIPMDDGQAQLYDDEDEEDYDLSPDEDELDEDTLDPLEDEESDELDDIEDPRIIEVASEDEAPELLKANGKGKNKRPAEDSADEEDEASLDALMASALKQESAPATNGDTKKLSKSEKKKLKKLKKNDGEAAAVAAETGEPKKEAAAINGSEKKSVQFAKNLEQGPTPSATPPAKAKDKKADTDKTASVGVKEVQGVTIDDRKLGTGPAAKKGSRVQMRYIGKLESGKVFDSNKKGPPFTFKLGMGEVIKGWDIGVAGMSVGGERRLTIPAHHGYGKKGAPPDIPPNSKLIFDIKCLSVQ